MDKIKNKDCSHDSEMQFDDSDNKTSDDDEVRSRPRQIVRRTSISI